MLKPTHIGPAIANNLIVMLMLVVINSSIDLYKVFLSKTISRGVLAVSCIGTKI